MPDNFENIKNDVKDAVNNTRSSDDAKGKGKNFENSTSSSNYNNRTTAKVDNLADRQEKERVYYSNANKSDVQKGSNVQRKGRYDADKSNNNLLHFTSKSPNNWLGSFSRKSCKIDFDNDTNDQVDDTHFDDFWNKPWRVRKSVSDNDQEIGKIEIPLGTIKEVSFVSDHLKKRPTVCFDYSCKIRYPPLGHSDDVKLSTSVKEKMWLEGYKKELNFLQENFSDVLPGILYDVVRKRPTDPVYYMAYLLIKHVVDESMNVKIIKRVF
ncbi:Hypothetical protein CINCED_3A006250 [Cinara cedri]|uniref:Uncharacterized protein n=1 Tax=Cinara cedri TaxID=506608 RepID=A0A5E4MX00_9HEMI|nr:Hypothetical protein CINCED_3A006250 [Cinara cedri]